VMLAAMKKLVQASGGVLGQSMLDLGVAGVLDKYKDDAVIMKGVKMIEELGGVELEAGEKGVPKVKKGGAQDQAAISPAIRGKKKTDNTLRGLASGEESGRMTEESVLTREQLFDIVRQAITDTVG